MSAVPIRWPWATMGNSSRCGAGAIRAANQRGARWLSRRARGLARATLPPSASNTATRTWRRSCTLNSSVRSRLAGEADCARPIVSATTSSILARVACISTCTAERALTTMRLNETTAASRSMARTRTTRRARVGREAQRRRGEARLAGSTGGGPGGDRVIVDRTGMDRVRLCACSDNPSAGNARMRDGAHSARFTPTPRPSENGARPQVLDGYRALSANALSRYM